MRNLCVYFCQTGVALLSLGTLTLPAQVSVLTWHNDNARTGFNPNETVLNRTNVNMNGFAKIFSLPVDGWVYAQPLYVSGLSIPGKGIPNVEFTATMHETLYAFDSDSNS